MHNPILQSFIYTNIFQIEGIFVKWCYLYFILWKYPSFETQLWKILNIYHFLDKKFNSQRNVNIFYFFSYIVKKHIIYVHLCFLRLQKITHIITWGGLKFCYPAGWNANENSIYEEERRSVFWVCGNQALILIIQ